MSASPRKPLKVCELRIDPTVGGHWQIAAQPGQRYVFRPGLEGAGQHPGSLGPLQRAEDKEARRLVGPGYVLDDDAEAWVAVMETYRVTSAWRARTCR